MTEGDQVQWWSRFLTCTGPNTEWGVVEGTFYMPAFHPDSSRVRCAFTIPSACLSIGSGQYGLPRAGRGASCLSPQPVGDREDCCEIETSLGYRVPGLDWIIM